MLKGKYSGKEKIHIVIDRFIVSDEDEDLDSRAADSVQTAFFEGHGFCLIDVESNGKKTTETFSNKFEADGIDFEEPSVNLFSFNNPYGACKSCEGFGNVIGIDPDLVIPNKGLSVYEEAIVCWKGEKMGEWKEALTKNCL